MPNLTMKLMIRILNWAAIETSWRSWWAARMHIIGKLMKADVPIFFSIRDNPILYSQNHLRLSARIRIGRVLDSRQGMEKQKSRSRFYDPLN